MTNSVSRSILSWISMMISSFFKRICVCVCAWIWMNEGVEKIGCLGSREREAKKWKMEIDLYLNDAQHEWLIAVIFSHCTFHISHSSRRRCSTHKKKFIRRAFLMCRRGPINVKKPQTKWQLHFLFFLPFQYFFFALSIGIALHWMLSCLLSCVTWNCLLALWYAMNISGRERARVNERMREKWTHLQI